MQIGDKITFTPSAFASESAGAMPGQKPVPRQVKGRVCYINRKHRYFMAEAMVNGQIIRESFKIKPAKQ